MSTARPFPVAPPAPPPLLNPEPAELDISVIVPVLNEAETVALLSERVAAVLEGLGKSFEIVFVDDGSGARGPAARPAGQAGPPTAQLRQGGGALRGLRPLDRAGHHHHGRRPPG